MSRPSASLIDSSLPALKSLRSRQRVNTMAKSQKHIHKFRRHRFKTGNVIYFCALPDCGYKIAPALALGKRCICWKCGREFEMDDYTCRLAKPHCKYCHVSKSGLTTNPEATAPDVPTPQEIHEQIPGPVITEELSERLNHSITEDSAKELSRRLRGNFTLEAKPDEDVEI